MSMIQISPRRRPLAGLCLLLMSILGGQLSAQETTAFAELFTEPVTAQPLWQPVNFQQMEAAIETQQYEEVLLSPQPVQGDSLHPERYIEEPGWNYPFLVQFRTGVASYEADVEDYTGGLWAVDAALPLYRSLMFYGSLSGTHFDQDSDDDAAYLGTVGLMKVSNPESRRWAERLGWGVFFDRYEDDRFHALTNTQTEGDFSQMRFNVNYLVTPRDTIGITWNEDIDAPSRNYGGLVRFQGALANSVEIYATHEFDLAYLTGTIGHRSDIEFIGETMSYGVTLNVPLTDNVNLTANHFYEDAELLGHRYTSVFAVEITLGPKSRRHAECAPECARNSSAEWTVVSSGNSQETVRGAIGSDPAVGQMRAEAASLRSQANALRAEYDSVNSQLANAMSEQTAITAQLDQLDAEDPREDELEARSAALLAQISALGLSSTNLATRIGFLESQAAGLEQRADDAASPIDESSEASFFKSPRGPAAVNTTTGTETPEPVQTRNFFFRNPGLKQDPGAVYRFGNISP